MLKVSIYAAQGVKHLWLVEPVDCRIEAYVLEKGRWVWIGTSSAAAIPPFDAVALDLTRLWQSTGLRG